jgi:two-component system chemotaxis response regulator CheY
MAKILIVDDSNLSRRLLRRCLEGAGHEVVEASDGVAALERYAADKPALVFLDMTMVGMSGLDVLIKLRERDPQARVIIATADIQDSTRKLVAAAGASGFLNKPFVAERVLEAADAVLGRGAP